MTKILIVGEQRQGMLKRSTAELISAAAALGGEIHGALLGKGSRDAASEFAAFGLKSLAVLDGDLPEYSSDAFGQVLAKHVQEQGFQYVLLQNSFFGRDLGARAASLLQAGWLNDVIRIDSSGSEPVFVKPLYAGKLLGQFSFGGEAVRVVTIRAKNFASAETGTSTVEATLLPLPASYKSRVTALEAKAEGVVDLKDADIIVSGGRGLGGPEGFEPLRKLARSIGAALGASRATVDAGWIDHSHQVGQTGKVVNPQIYFACGISGAIQHLAGMQTSKCIVAINSNENAPIFKVADYGIVGDVFEIVPELEKQLVEVMNS